MISATDNQQSVCSHVTSTANKQNPRGASKLSFSDSAPKKEGVSLSTAVETALASHVVSTKAGDTAVLQQPSPTQG